MDILNKHKKLGIPGFKNFVIYLEQSEPKRVEDMLQLACLEDPVYAEHIETNIVNFEYFLNHLTVDDFVKIHDSLPSGPSTFTFAFKDSPERDILTTKLPILMERRIGFAEEKIAAITPKQRFEARNILLKRMRELEIKQEITRFNWKLPSENIAKGQHYNIPVSGFFDLRFPSGKMALEGQYLDKLRTGVWKHYSPLGQIYALGTYAQGEKIGQWVFFYPNGKVLSEGIYVANLRHGPWKVFTQEGTPSIVKYDRNRPI